MKQEDIMALIRKIQSEILISHNIVNRIRYPAYCSAPAVPELLVGFKHRLVQYRAVAVECATQIGKESGPLFSSEVPGNMGDISARTFAQQFVCSLAVYKFGIGECAECASALAIELIKAGETSIAFVSVSFNKAELNMEQGHMFLIANLPNRANPIQGLKSNMPLSDFLECVPQGACVVDPFLELCFPPRESQAAFSEYLSAYGGEATLTDFVHFFNFRKETLRRYLVVADIIATQLAIRVEAVEQEKDFLFDKIRLEHDTSLIQALNSVFQNLHFFGVRDNAYKVDAVVQLSDDRQVANAKRLQASLKGYGQFFRSKVRGERYFVLPGINLPEGDPSVGERIQSFIRLQHKRDTV